jgi:hypothetical protein
MNGPSDNAPATPNTGPARLARWLAEWELLKALTPENAGGTGPPDRPLPDTPAGSTSSPVRSGDIRLLHPLIEPGAVRYVAVTTDDGEDAWFVVPFGLLAEPATPDEVLTRRGTPPLRVLCPWNRFHMSTSMLQRCWLVDRLTDEEATWCRSGLPPDRTGAPLRHPLDPRWDYLEMESAFRQRVCHAAPAGMTYEIPYPSALRKAAEDSTPYGHSIRSTEEEHEDDA